MRFFFFSGRVLHPNCSRFFRAVSVEIPLFSEENRSKSTEIFSEENDILCEILSLLSHLPRETSILKNLAISDEVFVRIFLREISA